MPIVGCCTRLSSLIRWGRLFSRRWLLHGGARSRWAFVAKGRQSFSVAVALYRSQRSSGAHALKACTAPLWPQARLCVMQGSERDFCSRAAHRPCCACCQRYRAALWSSAAAASVQRGPRASPARPHCTPAGYAPHMPAIRGQAWSLQSGGCLRRQLSEPASKHP